MRRGLQLVLLIVLIVVSASAGEIIDGIVATVNGHAILLSDVDEALRYEALLNGRGLDTFTQADRKAALSRLIDQELLREQMEGLNYRHIGAEELRQQLLRVRKQFPEAATDEAWRALLARYGFTEEELSQRIASQLDTVQFLDLRLRPSVHIEAPAIEAYYRDRFLPELRKSGAPEVPLADVSGKIEEVLAQQRMDELLNEWLRNLREQSDIRETAARPNEAGGAGLQ